MSEKILFMLARIQHALTMHVKTELKKEGIVLSPGQIGILLALEKEKQTTMGELSRILEMDNAAASRLVDKLEKQGLVERLINPKDRRQIKIRATDKGLGQAVITKNVIKTVNLTIQDGFSKEEIETYNRVNQSIIQKFNPRGGTK